MVTAQDKEFMQPGSDHAVHSQNLQQNVARELESILGQPVTSTHVTPTVEQQAVDSSLTEPVKPEADFQEIWDGLNGRPRTDRSNNFLKILKRRLLDQNPGKVIKER